MSNFKLIFIGVFGAAALFGILVFSGIIPLGSSSSSTQIKGNVVVWGTLDSGAMTGFITDYNQRNIDINVTYLQKNPATFDQTLVEALATGQAPDLVLLPDSLINRFQNKLTHVQFGSLPAQVFQTTFTSAANIFSVSDGYLAVPWASDPLVMYYNRDLLQSAGIAEPPKNWDTFIKTVPLLSKKTNDLTLTQMAVALGTYKNISHPKEILALLFMENGNPFITLPGGQIAVHFGGGASGQENDSAAQAVNFYMSFSDPVKQSYSWNAGEPLDRDAFISSTLAYYFGTASELPLLRTQNPNLNFGISVPPQSAGGVSMTTGDIYGLAIPKNAPNALLSFTAATLLTSAASENALATKLGSSLTLVPIRRDVLAQKPQTDPYLGFLYDAALVQRSWADPNPVTSDQIFSTLIRDLSSGTLLVDQALSKAGAQLSTQGGTI